VVIHTHQAFKCLQDPRSFEENFIFTGNGNLLIWLVDGTTNGDILGLINLATFLALSSAYSYKKIIYNLLHWKGFE
jgi:hypothetical protein